MGKNIPKTFNVCKIIGLVIALAAIGLKVFWTVYYFDSITAEYGRLMGIYWTLYLVSVAAAVTPFTRGWTTMVMSLIVMSLEGLLLVLDGIFFVAKLFDPSHRTMTEMGYFPLVNFLFVISSVFCLIGFLMIKSKEGRIAKLQAGD